MKEIVIATKNSDKKRELTMLLKGTGIRIISLDKYPAYPKVREGSKSFRENAVRKAMAASRFTRKITLADDSGLQVNALGGRPGIRSSRFAGTNATYAQNNQLLLKLLKGKKTKQRGAQFICVAAICDYPKLVGVVEGTVKGGIALAPKGKSGFGYDPIFIIPRYKKTFAQLGPKIKNRLSHRAQALKRAKRLITIYFNSKAQ